MCGKVSAMVRSPAVVKAVVRVLVLSVLLPVAAA